MLCSQAFAAAGPAHGIEVFLQVSPFILIFVLMYFLMIRPQQKRAVEHQKLVDSLERGNKVVTNAGIIGTIVRKRENEFILEIADGVQITILKNSVSGPYTTPNDAPAEKKTESSTPYQQPKASDTNTIRRVKKKDRV